MRDPADSQDMRDPACNSAQRGLPRLPGLRVTRSLSNLSLVLPAEPEASARAGHKKCHTSELPKAQKCCCPRVLASLEPRTSSRLPEKPGAAVYSGAGYHGRYGVYPGWCRGRHIGRVYPPYTTQGGIKQAKTSLFLPVSEDLLAPSLSSGVFSQKRDPACF